MSWFSPNTVARFFYPAHIRFVLRNLSMILLGIWPTRDRPDGTDNKSYVESPGEWPSVNKKGYYSAPWENIISIGVIVEGKIDACGRDGRLARAVYTQGINYWKLAHLERIDPQEVQERVDKAIRYASGKRRKTESYEEWENAKHRRN